MKVLTALALWAVFCATFMSFEIGLFVNLALGNVLFCGLWLVQRRETQEWILSADEWEDVAMQWKADALSWQHIALRPKASHEFTGRQQ